MDEQKDKYDKVWNTYLWMLNNSYEREKNFDDFSFNILKLFITLNSTAIFAVIIFALNNSSNLLDKKEILIDSILFWLFGIISSFICLICWYFFSVFSLHDAEKTYQQIHDDIYKNKSIEQPKETLIKKTALNFAVIIVLASGLATGILFVLGTSNLILLI